MSGDAWELRGEDGGGDCASALSDASDGMKSERLLLLDSAFIGLDFVLVHVGWQMKACPSPEI